MANFVYTNAKRAFMSGEIDMHTGGDDIRVLLVMSNTTADTEADVATISAITTLDEYDGANYVRKALAGEVVSADNANDRGEFDANDLVWTALGAGTRNCQAAIVFKFVTNDADHVPIAYLDTGTNLPFAGNGGDVTFSWNAEGIVQIA